MCVRKKPSDGKPNQRAFAQHLGGFGQQQEGNAAQVGGNARTNNGSNNNERDAKEKPKPFIKGMLPAGFGSGEFIKKRKDDDTLREVGNVMPEYDCDKNIDGCKRNRVGPHSTTFEEDKILKQNSKLHAECSKTIAND